jgi:hypothetical protein
MRPGASASVTPSSTERDPYDLRTPSSEIIAEAS